MQGLLHSPKLLFLDEPTAGLDPLMQRKFFDLIREENARGVTVFFSSHILGEVQRLCNRVGIIREGKIVEISDIRTLQQNNYKKVRVTAEGLNPAAFNLPGVTNLQTENGTVHFFFKGDINAVLQKISGCTGYRCDHRRADAGRNLHALLRIGRDHERNHLHTRIPHPAEIGDHLVAGSGGDHPHSSSPFSRRLPTRLH